MSNADNSRIANNAVDTIDKIAGIAELARKFDKDSIASAALLDILKKILEFTRAEMAA